MVTKINTEAFNAIDKTGIVVVDFNATWCGPCQMLAPIIEEVSEDMASEASFYAIDTDENPDLARQYGIMSIPAVVVLKDGVKAGMNVGLVTADELTDFIEQYI